MFLCVYGLYIMYIHVFVPFYKLLLTITTQYNTYNKEI